MHRAGFANAVAPLGTAFTPEQAKLVKRYADEVSLAFDADGAGQKAFLRAAEILLPLSVSIRMISIPGGKDPDELYTHGGAEAVAAAVNASVPWLEQLGRMLPGLYDMTTPVGKGQAAAFLAGLFVLVRNQVEFETYVQEGARLLGVSEEAIFAEVHRLRNKERRTFDMRSEQKAPAPAPVPAPAAPERSALLTLLGLALSSDERARAIAELLPPGTVESTSTAWKALDLLVSGSLNGETVADSAAGINELLNDAPDAEVGKLLFSPPKFADPDRALQDSVAELFRIGRRRRYAAITAEIRSCTDSDRRQELMKQLQEVLKEK